jgi:hypothetical protein
MLLQHDSRNVHGCVPLLGGCGSSNGCSLIVYYILSYKFYTVIFQVIKPMFVFTECFFIKLMLTNKLLDNISAVAPSIGPKSGNFSPVCLPLTNN